MSIIDEINKKIPEIKRGIAFFDILLYINPDKENLLCMDCLKEVYSHIEKNIFDYDGEECVYNRIDNDYQTLNDLFAELKQYVYPQIPFAVSMLLSTLKYDELLKVKAYIKNKEEISLECLKNEVSKLYFKYKNHIPSFSSDTTLQEVSTYIGAIHTYLKENLDEDKDEYLSILTDYIKLYLKDSLCTNN